MDSEYISETGFLLTELRYTLGQLHVQVLDLDAQMRSRRMTSGRSVDGILTDMLAEESRYQQLYAELLNIDSPTGSGSDERVPLPINENEESPSLESSFEHKRAQTIHLLEAAPSTWPDPLVEAVRQHVAHDRSAATEIAECRMGSLTETMRPDLQEPLIAPAERYPGIMDDTPRSSQS